MKNYVMNFRGKDIRTVACEFCFLYVKSMLPPRLVMYLINSIASSQDLSAYFLYNPASPGR
jgi:hypothetical protein